MGNIFHFLEFFSKIIQKAKKRIFINLFLAFLYAFGSAPGDGEVVDETYLGSTVEYLVETSDGNTLKVLTMSTAERFNIGDKVLVQINN